MIKVFITKKEGIFKSVLIKGHAEYDVNGKDIVCASVSALVLCTVNNISALEDNTIKVTTSDNEFQIDIIKNTNINTKLLDNMIKSLSQLEEKYSKNIKIYIGGTYDK